jgi:hypothetical protein
MRLTCRRGKRDQRERLGPAFGHGLNRLLCGFLFLQERMEEVGGHVRTIVPNNGIDFIINMKPTKQIDIAQWFKHFTPKFSREINLSFYSIVKLNPQNMFADVFGFGDMNEHTITPTEVYRLMVCFEMPNSSHPTIPYYAFPAILVLVQAPEDSFFLKPPHFESQFQLLRYRTSHESAAGYGPANK